MNTQTVVAKESKGQTQSRQTVSTINSTDALNMVEHSSELSISVTTPVGTKFQCKTAFIGTHGKNLILIEVPKISDDDLNFFFQEGFWLNVKAISPRGEGAMIHFRSQLVHYIREPIAMVAISIPNTMQVTQLRKEPRYDVNLPGKVVANTHKGDCEVRDLSKGGCRFITPPLSRPFQVGDTITIDLAAATRDKTPLAPLVGKICNLQRSLHYARYGLEFDERGKENAKALLSQLKFNGTKLMLK
ncbi:flagellar brake protein [Vibrio sp. SCSIO 43135]|uniref:flagellar brake protein n=1 Tax=Vibrio sp. SCSIO 43135 TaxID=2819096 RepID=UPI0020750C9F|nr:flagellar brake protein [Vibrio sp. SCSIO 43135]USD43489.1 flagellar brake protein [Vibrio sp. SCSIO 43135]